MENKVEYILTQWTLTGREFAIIDGWNNYKLHQIISNIFDESCQFEVNTKDGDVRILIKSKSDIKLPLKIGNFSSKNVKIHLFANNVYKIKTKLNATKEIKNVRVPLVGYDQISQWVLRKSEDLGMVVESVYVGNTQRDHIIKNETKIPCVWHDVEITGILKNVDNLKKIIEDGLGKQRKFGYGFAKIYTI